VRQGAAGRGNGVNGTACRDYGPQVVPWATDNPEVTDRRPPRGAWLLLATVNAVLAVGAAFALVPWLIVAVALLAELGVGSVDASLVDDGLTPWVLAAVAGTALYAVVALSVNLVLVRRTRLRGRPWPLVAVFTTLVVAGPVAVYLTPGLW
jgi:hypothetical protein